MLERKVDGVAVMTFGEEEPVLDQLVHRGVPIVLAEFKLDDPKASTILLDYSTGIRAAVRHLAELGHRSDRISCRTAQSALGHHPRKRLPRRHGGGRAAASRKNGSSSATTRSKAASPGFEQLRKLAIRPTAIVCSNDMTAIGVLRAAYMAGLRVPQDLSVIGLDDIDFAEFTLPPLTTIRLSRAELARAAFEALRMQAEEPGNPKMQARVSGFHQPVVRGSTAPPPPPIHPDPMHPAAPESPRTRSHIALCQPAQTIFRTHVTLREKGRVAILVRKANHSLAPASNPQSPASLSHHSQSILPLKEPRRN